MSKTWRLIPALSSGDHAKKQGAWIPLGLGKAWMIPGLLGPFFQLTPGIFRSHRRMHMSSFGIITVPRTALDDEEWTRWSMLLENKPEDSLFCLILKRNILCAFTVFLSREAFQTSKITVHIKHKKSISTKQMSDTRGEYEWEKFERGGLK